MHRTDLKKEVGARIQATTYHLVIYTKMLRLMYCIIILIGLLTTTIEPCSDTLHGWHVLPREGPLLLLFVWLCARFPRLTVLRLLIVLCDCRTASPVLAHVIRVLPRICGAGSHSARKTDRLPVSTTSRIYFVILL